MALHVTRRRFTVDEYQRMAAAGILGEDDRVELLDGEIVEMTPIGRRHAACVKRLNRLFIEGAGQNAVVGVQDPILIGEHSEPQPDVSIVRPRPDFYAAGHPTPVDVLLLIEVADTSVEVDRCVKVPLYARGGVGEVWLIDLEQDTVTVYREPAPDGYRAVRVARRGKVLRPAGLPRLDVAVDDLLGSAPGVVSPPSGDA